MKIRKTKSLLYIFSSVMVLGLSLLSFDNAKPSSLTVENTTPTPKENAKDKEDGDYCYAFCNRRGTDAV